MKNSRGSFTWLYVFAAIALIYFLPLVLLIADFGSGNLWFEKNAPQQVKDAVEYIYLPLDWLMNWWMPAITE